MDAISSSLASNATVAKYASEIQGLQQSDTKDPESIANAAKEFESVFLSMLLKNMRATVSEEGLFAGDKSDTLGGMFDLFMSQHLSNSDALGVSKMLKQTLSEPVSQTTNKPS
ncbi:MAG: hypothetical protein GY819_05745 [Planctomycetaceae bacterium]|nr:hypothetical protein [Planctomycetaceae bacterium]MCP4462287.1 hypothetical protein [Planctomycetaceae bacterium]MDG1808125.1 rod-binding protein [Pirellulaceae bacterium]MDG2103878.1 rod-binding protein [Pirellulaceae bacterium]